MSEANRELRVLHILGELRPSGAECMLKVAARTFASASVSTEILSTGTLGIGSYAETLRNVGYRIHHIPFSKSFAFVVKIYKFLRLHRFDVVHIHSERANFWLGLSAFLAGVPRIVSTVHGTFAFRGVLRVRRMIFRRLLHWFGVVQVSIGPSVQEVEWRHFRSKTKIVPNWYDSIKYRLPTDEERRLARANYEIANDAFTIVSVGNCSKIKNHTALIEAIALLPHDLQIVYLHVGAEEPTFPERTIAEKLGRGRQIRFLGQLEDPLPALFASDLFVMPSIHEGFGIAALEAAAVGVPLLLTDVSGLRDFKRWLHGVIYSEPTVNALKQALMGLISRHRDTKPWFSNQNSELVRELFGIERGVGEYVRIYRGTNKIAY